MAKNANFNTLQKQLTKTFESNKDSKNKALKAVKKDLSDWRAERDKWVAENTIGFDKRISKLMTDRYAAANGQLESEVVKLVRRGIGSGDGTVKKLKETLSLKTGKAKVYAETIAVTARMMQNRTNYLETSIKAGAQKFRYSGPPAERDFCTSHLNNIYTLDEILAMSNGQGLDVLTSCGGWRCKHYCVAVYEPSLQLASDAKIWENVLNLIA